MSDDKLPVSVQILTRNSDRTLRRALESVRDCADILLIDGGSTDQTLAIGREFGARLIDQPEKGHAINNFAAARNAGLSASTQSWILILDSDEIVSPLLLEEVKNIVRGEALPAAYFVPRKYLLQNGEVVEYASTYPNERIYFFHRKSITQWIKPVHERVELASGSAAKHLNGATLAPLPTPEEFKKKNLQYISIEAVNSRGKGWMFWLRHRLLHTLRSRIIATLRLLWIWIIPRKGKRLPLRHELLRYWYAWKLVLETRPRMAYYELLRYVFKRFSVRSALRTALPTASYYFRRPHLPESSKPALFTMNILPPMMTVWYHLARKSLGDNVDIVIFDCSGKLDPQEFPGARVQKFLNFYAATKCDEFLYHLAKNRRTGWLCDDDVFLLDSNLLAVIEREFRNPQTASVSFRPRSWWHFEIDGKRFEPSGSYCIAFNREIFAQKEHLTLRPCDGNTHPTHIGKGERRYDTGDKANEILLQKGYRCFIASEEEQHSIAAFTGMSGAVMLLNYFKKPEQVLDFFLTPPKEAWSGNVLPGVLSAMLAICTIQECYEILKGKRYPLPSLPSRSELEKIRQDHKDLVRPDQSFEWVDEVSERIKKAL